MQISISIAKPPDGYLGNVLTVISNVDTDGCAFSINVPPASNSPFFPTQSHTCTCVYTCTHMYVHTCTHMYVHTCTHMYVHMHKHAYTCMYTHAHAHVAPHTHTNVERVAHNCSRPDVDIFLPMPLERRYCTQWRNNSCCPDRKTTTYFCNALWLWIEDLRRKVDILCSSQEICYPFYIIVQSTRKNQYD